ncbi:hypothetical protein CRG98_000732 [Punica granatum]|uniref:Uncharacterized protein n=1 Tax=Punica granatum TaxID=22663 RepID=A0A2I0LDV9_PUNGR|nr:hypothetical protein CRG98_000732 [Punica granatum]
MGIKLGRIEGPVMKKEEEVSKKHTVESSRRAKDTTAYHPTPLIVIQPPPPQQHAPVQSRALASRPPQLAQRTLAPQGHQGSAAQPHQRKQFTPLPASPSYMYRQLLAGNKIRPEAPHPNFDPTVQNQSIHCEIHQGAPTHTTDNCWRLQEKIHQMIDAKQISINEAKPSNVRANTLPDHGSSSGPTINKISISEEKRMYREPHFHSSLNMSQRKLQLHLPHSSLRFLQRSRIKTTGFLGITGVASLILSRR